MDARKVSEEERCILDAIGDGMSAQSGMGVENLQGSELIAGGTNRTYQEQQRSLSRQTAPAIRKNWCSCRYSETRQTARQNVTLAMK